MIDTDRKQLIGHCYIARRPCGMASAMAWDDDDPKEKKAIERSISDWIKRGDTVERVARYDGDPIPENIMDCPCRRGEKEPCNA